MIYLITAVHEEKLIKNINKTYLKEFLSINNEFKSFIVIDNFKLKNKKIYNDFDKVIFTKKELFFFGSLLFGLKEINIREDDRIIFYNVDSILFDFKKKYSVDFKPFFEKEVTCGRFKNSRNKQSYGAWYGSNSFLSPRIHNNKSIQRSINLESNYICNSNLLSFSGDIILEIFEDNILYSQTYLDFVISKIACNKKYPLRVIDIPILVERHQLEIIDKFTNKSSKFYGIESPFNPLNLGLQIRSKYFKRTVIPFFVYRLMLFLKSIFRNLRINY